MAPKTMKEEVEAVDRKVLAYCEKVEEAMGPVAEIKTDAPHQPGYVMGLDGMDMARAVHRQVLRARDLAWAVQRLPYLDLSFMNTMKRQEFKIQGRRGDEKKMTIALPAWIVGNYPSWSGNKVYHDPKSKSYDGLMGFKIPIPEEVVAQNAAAIGDEWVRTEAMIPEVPTALRRRIDPFLARFDSVAVIAEADWTLLPGADPLVVGIFETGSSKLAFLLGEYDPTKLEKYIVAELAVKPKE